MTQDEYEKKIAGHREEILAFQTSKVWELWLELAEMQKEAHKHNAVYAGTQEERDKARYSVLALDKFRGIPFALVRKVESLSQEKAA